MNSCLLLITALLLTSTLFPSSNAERREPIRAYSEQDLSLSDDVSNVPIIPNVPTEPYVFKGNSTGTGGPKSPLTYTRPQKEEKAISTKGLRGVACVVQAFGSGLSGKGISVELVNSACFNKKTEVNAGNAMFDSRGEAEVQVILKAVPRRVKTCLVEVRVKAILPPYGCSGVWRTISAGARWGLGGGPLGRCITLPQICGTKESIAAVPYIDMWCRKPSASEVEPGAWEPNPGQPTEMKLDWINARPDDKC